MRGGGRDSWTLLGQVLEQTIFFFFLRTPRFRQAMAGGMMAVRFGESVFPIMGGMSGIPHGVPATQLLITMALLVMAASLLRARWRR